MEKNLTEENNYEWIARQVDIENFIDYILYNWYISCGDWLTNYSNNILMYRSVENTGGIYSDAKWRWIVHDMDAAFASYNPLTLERCMEFEPAAVDQSVCKETRFFTNLLLQKLWENAGFREQFVERYYKFTDTARIPDKLIKEFFNQREKLEPEIHNNLKRQARQYTEIGKVLREENGEDVNFYNMITEEWIMYSEGILTFLQNREEVTKNELLTYVQQ